MKYIKIKNDGLMDYRSLMLMGASTKVNDNTKIGRWGSGNKFALAYFLRNEHEVKIFAGLDEIKIKTKPVDFRGEMFDVVFVNKEQTSITTNMGIDWKLWQSIREIYCNAIDEGGCTFEYVQEIKPVAGETHYYISTHKDITDFVSNFDNYFAINKKVLFECPSGRIVEKTGTMANIYRKGIRCFDTNKSSLYDYDFSEITIDENRIVMYSWHIEEKIWDLIFQCDSEEIIMNVLHNSSRDIIEGCFVDYSSLNISKASETFRKCIRSINIAPESYAGLLKPDEVHNHVIIPTRIFNAVRPIVGDDKVSKAFKVLNNTDIYREVDIEPLHQVTINMALDFFKECEFEMPYPVIMALFSDKDILATVDKENIILSDVIVERGVNEVVNCIIEEYIHIKYQVRDETRAFQDKLCQEFVTYMKKKNAFAL